MIPINMNLSRRSIPALIAPTGRYARLVLALTEQALTGREPAGPGKLSNGWIRTLMTHKTYWRTEY